MIRATERGVFGQVIDTPHDADLADLAPPAADVDLDHIPELLGDWRLRAILWARLGRTNRPAPAEDRLLVIADAASRLGVSKDWLYRNSGRLPFTVRLAERALRYSARASTAGSPAGSVVAADDLRAAR